MQFLLHQVSNMFETPAILQRQITLICRFTHAILKLQQLRHVSVTKIACVNQPLGCIPLG